INSKMVSKSYTGVWSDIVAKMEADETAINAFIGRTTTSGTTSTYSPTPITAPTTSSTSSTSSSTSTSTTSSSSGESEQTQEKAKRGAGLHVYYV
ncbi:MAG: hypothetical protein ACP5ME_13740, partial [Anaerolineae bacterium]